MGNPRPWFQGTMPVPLLHRRCTLECLACLLSSVTSCPCKWDGNRFKPSQVSSIMIALQASSPPLVSSLEGQVEALDQHDRADRLRPSGGLWPSGSSICLRSNGGPSRRSLNGLALGFLIGFRNNHAYDRWWEARKLWGQLINENRNLCLKVRSLLGVEAGRPG